MLPCLFRPVNLKFGILNSFQYMLKKRYACLVFSTVSALSASNFTFSGSIADFYPLSKRVRQVYHNHIPQYGLKLDFNYYDPWTIWLGGSFVHDHGHSIGASDSTSFDLRTISAGLKYTKALYYSLSGYISAGPSYSSVSIVNHSPFVKKNINKDTCGILTEIGLSYVIYRNAEIRAYCGYSNATFCNSGMHNCVNQVNIDMSALQIGGSLGFDF